MSRDQPCWIVMGSCDITCQFCFSKGSQEPPCLLKPYFEAWAWGTGYLWKRRLGCPHESTVLGLGRRVRAALKRNYTHEAPEFSLWNPILSIACFWQTESILRMGQGSFKGIPASRTESHFQRQTGTFFPCQTGMLWQLGMDME